MPKGALFLSLDIWTAQMLSPRGALDARINSCALFPRLLEDRFAHFQTSFCDVITGKEEVQPIQPSAEQPRRTVSDDVTPDAVLSPNAQTWSLCSSLVCCCLSMLGLPKLVR